MGSVAGCAVFTQCEVCSVQCAVCSVQFAVAVWYSVQCALCSVAECAVVLYSAQMVRRQVLAGDRAWHTLPITATIGCALYRTCTHYTSLYCTYHDDSNWSLLLLEA